VSPERFDAVVVGAGTAGANAAYQLAAVGRRVALLERRPAGTAGARWCNGVLDRHFERAGLEPPRGAERVAEAATVHLFGPQGRHAVTVAPSPVVRADMRLLGARLRAMAADLGVEVVDRVEIAGLDLHRGRPTSLTLARHGGPPLRVEAPLFVDASGRRGVLGRRVDALAPWCPPVRGGELCSASDLEMRVDDVDGARRFLERHGAAPGETVTVVGPAGGFSTRAITVSEDLDAVDVLAGCLADGRHGTGPSMVADLRAEEPWIGGPFAGGSGVIPLRRPYARFTAPGVALVGDAACQVFPAHGSGIGMGLIAGKVLAEAVAAAGDPGDATALWGYQAAYQRELGGLLAAFDAFRRMSTDLGTGGVASMVAAGLATESSIVAGLDQRWATPGRADLARSARGLARNPRLAAVMVPWLARAQRLTSVGGSHPDRPDVAALARWDQRVGRLLGRVPGGRGRTWA
jgi:flavin-dependent dehydrogenase